MIISEWILMLYRCIFFFCSQKTAYEMRISDWSSDVCSSDLLGSITARGGVLGGDGGLVETSSHFGLNAQGSVDASSPRGLRHLADRSLQHQIGRASCRERVCQYV